jgi:DNA-directed RNA polymerase subunit beta
MDVSPRQMVSVATSLIPFLEHDDANRALMGANMQRQAVPLIKSEAPLVGTGMESYAAFDAGDVIFADKAGVVTEVSASHVTVMQDEGGSREYPLRKFERSNQGTSYNHRVIVSEGDKVAAGQVLADGPATEDGELALGKNLLVAFMPWEGHNFEDAIILSQRLVQDDVLTSIHIEEYEVDARDTKLGKEEITRDLPNVSPELIAHLDEVVGAEAGVRGVMVDDPKAVDEIPQCHARSGRSADFGELTIGRAGGDEHLETLEKTWVTEVLESASGSDSGLEQFGDGLRRRCMC